MNQTRNIYIYICIHIQNLRSPLTPAEAVLERLRAHERSEGIYAFSFFLIYSIRSSPKHCQNGVKEQATRSKRIFVLLHISAVYHILFCYCNDLSIIVHHHFLCTPPRLRPPPRPLEEWFVVLV